MSGDREVDTTHLTHRADDSCGYSIQYVMDSESVLSERVPSGITPLICSIIFHVLHTMVPMLHHYMVLVLHSMVPVLYTKVPVFHTKVPLLHIMVPILKNHVHCIALHGHLLFCLGEVEEQMVEPCTSGSVLGSVEEVQEQGHTPTLEVRHMYGMLL